MVKTILTRIWMNTFFSCIILSQAFLKNTVFQLTGSPSRDDDFLQEEKMANMETKIITQPSIKNYTPLKINGWNMSSWRFGSDDFPFQIMGDGCRFQPFIFQGVYLNKNDHKDTGNLGDFWKHMFQPRKDRDHDSRGQNFRRKGDAFSKISTQKVTAKLNLGCFFTWLSWKFPPFSTGKIHLQSRSIFHCHLSSRWWFKYCSFSPLKLGKMNPFWL